MAPRGSGRGARRWRVSASIAYSAFHIRGREFAIWNSQEVRRPAKARLSSVANSIRLLNSFSGEEDELGITTLATRMRLAKSTVHRLAATLTAAGFLEQNRETGNTGWAWPCSSSARWCAGAWTWPMRAVPSCASCWRRPARRSRWAWSTISACSMSTRWEPARHPHGGRGRRARAAALHRGGQGAARVSARGFRRRVLRAGLTAYTPKTLIKREAILSMLSEVRSREHAIDDEESESACARSPRRSATTTAR